MTRFKETLLVWLLLTLFAAFGCWLYAGTPSTEAVQSRSDGLHVTDKTTDRIGFYGQVPTPKPVIAGTVTAANLEAALAAMGLVATATPTPTPSATFTPTPTPTP